jgi:hypothetical protein
MSETTEATTYAEYWVSVTFANGRRADRSFPRSEDAQRYFDLRVGGGKAVEVLLSGTTNDGDCDGIDGWWAT